MERRATALSTSSGSSGVALLVRLLQVAKLPLCSAVAASALVGLVLAGGRLDSRAAALFFSVLLLAGGAAALNNCQDQVYDRFFGRTRERPVARGDLPVSVALVMAALLFVAGAAVLVMVTRSLTPLLVSLLVVVLYNGIYTRLKQKTSWALLPGAICGALPPLIGWLAGGGEQGGFGLVLVMVFMAVWQVPHFWLVLLDHRNDYRQAPYPSLADELSLPALHMVTFIWAAAFMSLVHTFFLIERSLSYGLVMINSISSLVVLTVFARELFYRRLPRYRVLFHVHNGFLLLLMTLVVTDNLWR